MQTSNITNHERNDSSWMSTVKSTTEVSWNKLSFCDVLLKIITFGIYSPHETLAEKYSEKKLMDSFSPSLSQDKMDGEFAHANIDGISIRLCLNKGICSVFYLDGDKIQSTQLSSKEYNNLLSSLPPKQFNLRKVHTITAPVSGNFKTHKPAPEVIETAINCCTSIIPSDDYFPVKDTDFNSVWHDIYRDIRASDSNSTKIYFNNIEIPLKLIADLINELGINEFIDSKKELQMLSYNQVNKIINSNFPQQDLCFQTEKLLFTSLFQDPAFISALTSAFWQSLHITSSSVEHIYAQIMSENIENRLNFMPEQRVINNCGHIIKINAVVPKNDTAISASGGRAYEVSSSILPSHITCNGVGINKIETSYLVHAGTLPSSEGLRNAIPPESRQVSFAIISPDV